MKTTMRQESAADYLMSQLEICITKEDLILAFWLYWVESVTTNARDYQKVLACSPVNRWFITELQKEESEYKNLIAAYPDTAGKERDWLYCKCISKLMSYFPQALLKEAKKQDAKSILTKIQGIRIELSTEKLN